MIGVETKNRNPKSDCGKATMGEYFEHRGKALLNTTINHLAGSV